MRRVSCVLDASALLALLGDEPGAERVEPLLPGAIISSVNWSEVVQKALAYGLDASNLRADLGALGMEVEPLSAEDAERAAQLWLRTREMGLSLADRACLALGLRLGAVVLTADRAWAALELDIVIVR